MKARAQTTGPPGNIQSSNFKQDTAMNFSQTAEYSRVYILDVHGTDRQTPVRPPRSSRKRKLSNFDNTQPTEGRNHGHEFCASHLLFFFFHFQLNSKVCNRNQIHTDTKHLKPGSPLGAACERQPARPPLRPLVLTQGRCLETAFPSGEAAHLPYLHTLPALNTVQV